MLIIFISFAMLTVITTVMVNNYAVNEKFEEMVGVSDASADYIEKKFKSEPATYFHWFMEEYEKDVENVLATVAKSSDDVTVIVTDAEGNILLCTGSKSSMASDVTAMPRSLMDEVNNGQNINGFRTVEGVFESSMLVTSAPIITRNYAVGNVFAFSGSSQLDELLEVMIKTFVLSGLWVMMAARTTLRASS